MKKIGIIIIIIILVVVTGFCLGKNIIAKTALSAGVRSITGLELKTESVDVGILKTFVGIEGLKVFNPEGFPDKIMINLPEIYIDYDLGSFLKRKVHLEEVRINLKEFIVVKNSEDELNLNSLKVIQDKIAEKAGEEKKTTEEGVSVRKGAEMPQIQIDELDLKIGKVVFKDYSKGTTPKVREFNIDIDERYENIDDLYTLGSLILVKALKNTTISRLANLDLGPLTEGVTHVLDKATTKVTETTKEALGAVKDIGEETVGVVDDTLKKTTETIKNILPFGQQD